MKIIWRDTDLKSHEINLENAVDVKIDGVSVTESGNGLTISCDEQLIVYPRAANSVVIKKESF